MELSIDKLKILTLWKILCEKIPTPDIIPEIDLKPKAITFDQRE